MRALFKDPLHPYTQMLIQSLPSLEMQSELQGIPGLPFSLLAPPPGCPFHPRCPKRMEHCSTLVPALKEVRRGHFVACHLY